MYVLKELDDLLDKYIFLGGESGGLNVCSCILCKGGQLQLETGCEGNFVIQKFCCGKVETGE